METGIDYIIDEYCNAFKCIGIETEKIECEHNEKSGSISFHFAIRLSNGYENKKVICRHPIKDYQYVALTKKTHFGHMAGAYVKNNFCIAYLIGKIVALSRSKDTEIQFRSIQTLEALLELFHSYSVPTNRADNSCAYIVSTDSLVRTLSGPLWRTYCDPSGLQHYKIVVNSFPKAGDLITIGDSLSGIYLVTKEKNNFFNPSRNYYKDLFLREYSLLTPNKTINRQMFFSLNASGTPGMDAILDNLDQKCLEYFANKK
jgi:hypothetical protein